MPCVGRRLAQPSPFPQLKSLEDSANMVHGNDATVGNWVNRTDAFSVEQGNEK